MKGTRGEEGHKHSTCMHAHTLVYKVKAHWPAWSFPVGGWCSLTAPSKWLISGAIDLAFPGNQL